MQNLTLETCVNDLCPVTGRPVAADALALYKGRVIGFATPADRDRFVGAYVAIEAALKGEAEVAAARERELTLAQAMELARAARAERWLAERAGSGFAPDAIGLGREWLMRDPTSRATLAAPGERSAAPVRRLPDNLAGTCH